MRKRFYLPVIFFICFFRSIFIYSQNTDPAVGSSSLQAPIPVDSSFAVRKLDNGFTYYIKVNKKPEKRAELRLAVNAGSVLEDDGQQGLAHFAEHMAFNGTEHFKKQELIDYLESIGMQFGPEINAYTGFDETVYMLKVPTDSSHIVEKAFLILEDWARGLSFDPDEIEKERGVIIEEWRLGRGAEARMRDKQFPVLFHGSKYAERLPIGRKAVLDTFRHEILRRFYRDWYRPDQMAVIAVGDFDPEQIDILIRNHFGALQPPPAFRVREAFPIPDHPETLFAIASDPEATQSRINIYFKRPLLPEKNLSDFRRSILENLYDGMMNDRLSELTKKADPPFIFAYSGSGKLLRTKGVYSLYAMVKDSGVEAGLNALLTEAKRAKQFGFTQSELDRVKAETLRSLERAYQEREKTESANFAGQAVEFFLSNDPMPGIEAEYKLNRQFLPDISLGDINQLSGGFITDGNRVVLVNVPQKEGIPIPADQDLLGVFKKVDANGISAYQDQVLDQPLVAQTPRSGRIIKEKRMPPLGAVEWTLSNGVHVVLKPTDFKNDQILLRAFSPGGNSLVPDSSYIAALTATAVMNEGGVGAFSAIALQKKLAGKIVSLTPQISQLSEGFSGSASPKDVETLFQLVYLYFTAPRKDGTTFLAYQSRLKGMIENMSANPEAAFRDTLQTALMQHHFRSRPISVPILNEMNLEESFRVFRDRFADAGDFTFFLVGSYETEKIKPLILSYLGGLPSIHRKETWRDVGVHAPEGIVRKTVRKGIEPKSRVSLVYTGKYKWNPHENHVFDSMLEVLRIRLREVLRENMGGTYGVGVGGGGSRIPRQDYSISISFGCSPDRVEEMIQAVRLQIDSLKTFGPKTVDVQKVKEMQIREFETNLKENGFWMGSLYQSYYDGQNPERIFDVPKMAHQLSTGAIQKKAQQYFNPKNVVQVILLPEENSKKSENPK